MKYSTFYDFTLHRFAYMDPDPYWDKSWTKIRTETNADPHHWLYVLVIHTGLSLSKFKDGFKEEEIFHLVNPRLRQLLFIIFQCKYEHDKNKRKKLRAHPYNS